eukprot:gnl/MRDRNA2_/MRDRNA2_225067_c0_seq1.p1 gnl/MRDRNA2_/MRDRNA2_225067_c0~~gnl/MRDRNA2_/MRDRNA2_225067_c0_seq1.p1  ORF type:complete len:334 (-),score=28.87 gnl/MRDRNA2_/MRDRNA2_225067_c0_seq1:361-1269(-)
MAAPAFFCATFAFPFVPIMAFLPLAVIVYPLFMWAVSKYMTWLVLGANILLVEQLLDRGLANLFLLETLRHKTSLWRYFAIRLVGGLCSTGGTAGGSTASISMDDDTASKFYLFKDTYWGDKFNPKEDSNRKHLGQWDAGEIVSPWRWVQPNIHAWLSARSGFSKVVFGLYYQDVNIWGFGFLICLLANIWGILIIMLPSIKFRCLLDDLPLQPFVNDPAYSGVAWWTQQDVPAWWIGPSGTVVHSFRHIFCGSFLKEIGLGPKRAVIKVFVATMEFAAAFFFIYVVDVRVNPLALMFLMYM